MAINFNLRSGSCSADPCSSKDGCPDGVCPDFMIRRHDTRPPLKVSVQDCDGPMDFRGLIIEVNMWAMGKLKADIDDTITYFRLSDDIGFEQVMVGDIIVLDRVRLPERMLVIGFDEANKLIQVERGYHATTPSAWKRGTTLRIFRIMNAPAASEMVFDNIQNVDGTTDKNVLVDSFLVYEWQPEDTCLPGCYWLEFKVLKMIDLVFYLPGGNWTGDTFQDVDGYFWTGTSSNDGSVRLSFDQITGYYLIAQTAWAGEFHIWSDDNYYTGTAHSDGSVVLNKTGVPSTDDVEYDSHTSLADVSITPSFTDGSLTPSDFGCILGEGVEWVRRFPLNGEGFLIKVTKSPTTEI
jgi:hypothetical protein